MAEEFIWSQKYRPKTIEDCVLPPRLKNPLLSYVNEGQITNNLLFEGPPGSGKTTAARALCEEIGLDYMVINSSEERGIDVFRTKIMDFASTISLTGNGKCVILDEADFLTPEAQAAFRGVIEKVSKHCTFIITCNYSAKLMDAIQSRMATYSFRFDRKESDELKVKMFKRIKEILKSENVISEDKAIVKLMEKYFPDFRKTLEELQRYSFNGKFDMAVVEQIGSSATINKLIEFVKEKNFGKVRQWLAENHDLDSVGIFRKIYDGLYDWLSPDSIPGVIILIGRYQFQHGMVPDPEINLAAFLVELMVEAKFK